MTKKELLKKLEKYPDDILIYYEGDIGDAIYPDRILFKTVDKDTDFNQSWKIKRLNKGENYLLLS